MYLALMGLRRDRFTVDDEALANVYRALAVEGEWENNIEDLFSRFGTGFIFLWRGLLPEAREQFNHALAMTEQSGEITTRSRVLNYLALVYRKLGQRENVREYVERTLKIAMAGQMIEYMGSARGHQAWLALREGDRAEAQRLGQEGYALMQKVPIGA